MLGRHDAVLHSPDDERGTVESTQPFGPLQQHLLRRYAGNVLAEISADLLVGKQRSKSLVHDLVRHRPPAHPAPRHRQTPERAQPQRLERQVDTAGNLRCLRQRAPGDAGRVVVEGLTLGEHQPPDAPVEPLGDEQPRPTSVVSDQGYLMQVQLLQELGY